MPRRLLGALGAVGIAIGIAALLQGGLIAATDTGVTNDAKGVRLTPAPQPVVLESEATFLSAPPAEVVRRAPLDSRLEREKREAMERSVLAALESVLAENAQTTVAADPTPAPTADPTPESTPAPTVEATPEATVAETEIAEPTAEPTPNAEYAAALAEIDAINSGEVTGDDGATADSAAEPNSYYLSEEFLRPYFGDNWEKASAVALCESSGNPNAVYSDENGAPLYVGLFQIYVGNWNGQYSGVDLQDPNLNAQLAAELSNGGASWADNWPVCGAGL